MCVVGSRLESIDFCVSCDFNVLGLKCCSRFLSVVCMLVRKVSWWVCRLLKVLCMVCCGLMKLCIVGLSRWFSVILVVGENFSGLFFLVMIMVVLVCILCLSVVCVMSRFMVLCVDLCSN